jgi:putative Mg2+ transporter-C (MgtC) family protein
MLWNFVSPEEAATLGRLLLAVFLGGVVGFERERSGKVAGLRTHALVALGAALFTVTSVVLYQQFPSVNGVQGYDYHLVANIIVGIGFIGAGTILKRDEKIQGITTAASLWVVAAIGMAAGFGFYKEAIATTVLVYFILTMLWLVEQAFRNRRNGNGS